MNSKFEYFKEHLWIDVNHPSTFPILQKWKNIDNNILEDSFMQHLLNDCYRISLKNVSVFNKINV